MNMRNNTCLISSLSLLCWAAVSVATAQLTESGEDKVPVALTYDIPPYITNEGTGGLEIAILTLALDSTDEFTYHQMSYDEVETAIDRGVVEISLDRFIPVDGSYEKDDNGEVVYYSYPSWPFHNYVFTKTVDNINNNEPINSIEELANIGPVFTWESAVDDLGDEFYTAFSNNTNYQPIGDQTEQVELFWNTSDALIVIDRTIFLALSEKIIETSDVPMDQLFVEHKLFDAVTAFGIGFKSKDMRDQFNSGLLQMCDSGDYMKLLVEYGIELVEDSEVICDIASANGKIVYDDDGTIDIDGTIAAAETGAGVIVLLSTVVVVMVSFSFFLL